MPRADLATGAAAIVVLDAVGAGAAADAGGSLMQGGAIDAGGATDTDYNIA